jgi:hypothetical protein
MDGIDLATAFATMKSALGLVKAAKDLLPESPQKAASETALAQAERAVEIAESQIADQMGYTLCQCAFPPGIALRKPDGSMRCPKCGRDTNEDYETTMVGPGGY